MRFKCVCLSGFLSGLGGACVTMTISNQFRPISIVGQGFIAIAAGGSSGIDTQLISMIPYVVTVILLILFVGRSRVPSASGKPYIKTR